MPVTLIFVSSLASFMHVSASVLQSRFMLIFFVQQEPEPRARIRFRFFLGQNDTVQVPQHWWEGCMEPISPTGVEEGETTTMSWKEWNNRICFASISRKRTQLECFMLMFLFTYKQILDVHIAYKSTSTYTCTWKCTVRVHNHEHVYEITNLGFLLPLLEIT